MVSQEDIEERIDLRGDTGVEDHDASKPPNFDR